MKHLSVTPSQRRPHYRVEDSQSAVLTRIACLLPLLAWTGITFAQEADPTLEEAVSYTHLTLPTKVTV